MPSASARARVVTARARERGIRSASGSSGSTSASRAGVGKSRSTTWSPARSRGSPCVATSRAVAVRAEARLTCCPRTVWTATSAPSSCPGTRRPGRACTRPARTSSSASAASTATGSASASRRRRVRSRAGARSRASARVSVHGTRPAGRSSPRCTRTTPEPWGRRTARSYQPGPVASRPGTTWTARKCSRSAAANGSRTATRVRTTPAEVGVRGSAARARSWVGVAAYTSRTVSLNWRTLANPAAWATSPKVMVVVSISTRAVWARRERARASGPAAYSPVRTRCSWREE